MRGNNVKQAKPGWFVLRTSSAAVLVALGAMNTANAFEFDTGNPDLAVRFDNTIRYTFGQRLKDQDTLLIGTGGHNIDDGNRNFSSGDTTANRIDLLTEFDVVYKQRHGFRVSAAAWGDQAYDSNMQSNQPRTWSNHPNAAGVPDYGLGDTTRRYAEGISGEILDAFVFTGFDVGDAKINLKGGKHTMYWGEAVTFASHGNSIAYSQMSVDVAKGLQMPGAEAKEVFRPRNAISAQAALTPEVSIAAQSFLDWEPWRFPNPGTYLGFHDALGDGAESFLAAPGAPFRRGDNIVGDKKKDWGLSARWSPEWLGGTMGFYYRNYTDMLPVAIAQPGVTFISSQIVPALNSKVPATLQPPGGFTVPNYLAGTYDATLGRVPTLAPFQSTNMLAGAPAGLGRYYQSFAGDVDMFGFSLGKNLGSVSTSMELSYRQNAPLVSFSPYVVNNAFAAVGSATNPTFLNVTAMPDGDNIPVARGKTFHVVLSALGLISSTPLFDSASWTTEFMYAHLDKVTDNAQYYKGQNFYQGIDKPTRDSFGIALNFTPTWFQVFPSADLSMPVSYNVGLNGNAPTASTINEGLGSYAFGLRLDYAIVHQFELRYVGYLGDAAYAPQYAGGPLAVTVNGPTASLRDREQLVFTYKTAF